SPLAAGFSRSQSGTKSRFASFQARVVFVARRIVGLRRSPRKPISLAVMYLPRVVLTAVLPSPFRSYEAAMRGVMSCILGPTNFGMAKPLGTYFVYPQVCSGNHAC